MFTLRKGGHLLAQQREDFRRREPAKRGRHLICEVVEREEAGERKQRQNRREEREEKVIGQLRREAEPVIGTGFFCRSRQQFAPAQGAFEVRKHGHLRNIAPR
jgi:hypothetical protein